MFTALLLVSLALVCQSTPVVYKPVVYSQPAPIYLRPAPVSYVAPIAIKEAPKPYSFAYEAPAIGGSSSRQESSDGNGRVVGSYTITDVDGRARVVDYYADETGFHADVKTNEPGTANQSPADVSVQSFAAPAISPVVSPKVIAAPPPVYTVAAPVRSVVAPRPLTYRIVPVYGNSLAYSPLNYDSYYNSYSPYKLGYYK